MHYVCHPLGEYSQDPNYRFYSYQGHGDSKLDFNAPEGKDVFAMFPGVITYAGWDSYGGGNFITLKSTNNAYSDITGLPLYLRYMHLSQILVTYNQEVKAGDLIGKSGNTGQSTGPHLHLDMSTNGTNPLQYPVITEDVALRLRSDYDYEGHKHDLIADLDNPGSGWEYGDNYYYHLIGQPTIWINKSSGGDVPEVPTDTHAGVIWNWFRNANIPNVSNRPELIAGIIGNFQAESYIAIDVLGNNGQYYGPWCESNGGFRTYVTNAGFTFHPYTSTPSNASAAIPTVLEWLTKYSESWVSWLSRVIDQVSSKTGEAGARAYAELFCVCVERCVGGTVAVDDPGVRQIMLDYYGGTSYLYQDLGTRRNNAAAIYNQFAR